MDDFSRKPQRYLIFNNIIFDGLGDLFLTIGFIPYIIFYLSLTEYLDISFYYNNLELFNFLYYIGQIALLFFLFTTIASINNTKNTLKSAIYYLVLGIIYYIAELILIFVLHNLLADQVGNAMLIIDSFMPSNYLLSISAFLFLGFLLLYKPNFKNDAKLKVVLFRLLSLIPLFYIILSYVLSVLSSLEQINIPSELSISFSGQYFIQEMFGLILISLLFIQSIINEKKEVNNKEKIKVSQLKKNIIVCSLIILISSIDWILCSVIEINNIYIFELGTMKYSIFLVPLFLLYKNDDSEVRYKKTYFVLDWYYTMIFVVLAMIYIILYLVQYGFTF